MKKSNEVPSFSIKSLFEAKDTYLIPVYQRNYAWGSGELRQLIQDIFDYASNPSKSDTPYYIGSLVVFERKVDYQVIYETIDGQQRLTTLFLLLNALHRLGNSHLQNQINFNLKLIFYSRPTSTITLDAISSNLENPVHFINTYSYNSAIQERYLDAEKVLKEIIQGQGNLEKLYTYLTQKVNLIRVSVPDQTDLNHYFEVMNNRGEQLEKHEVLKSKLLSYLQGDKESMGIFNRIWEATSDMERYVQYGFTPEERGQLFGSDDSNGEKWNFLTTKNFEEIKKILKPKTLAKDETETSPNTISSIVDYKGDFGKNTDHILEAPDRFNSVVNFQGFLLHILRIQTQKDVPLDDKRLIESFEAFIRNESDVKLFTFNLLKGKHLFDQFIIKREFYNEGDNWSLKRLKWYQKNDGKGSNVGYVSTFGDTDKRGINQEILMLLSMFHVSLPSMNYKHWLSAALKHLFDQESNKIDPKLYSDYLFDIAKSYFFDRILAPSLEKELDYFSMIFKDGYMNPKFHEEELNWGNLDKGTFVENFAFNFLDYVLWLQEGKPSFDFTFRSSVEHYYPQNPIGGEKLKEDILNSFGNLCLISSSKNSKLSNNLPSAKKDYYLKSKPDSLKQTAMMNLTSDSQPWGELTINKHRKEMIETLKKHY